MRVCVCVGVGASGRADSNASTGFSTSTTTARAAAPKYRPTLTRGRRPPPGRSPQAAPRAAQTSSATTNTPVRPTRRLQTGQNLRCSLSSTCLGPLGEGGGRVGVLAGGGRVGVGEGVKGRRAGNEELGDDRCSILNRWAPTREREGVF